MRLTIARYYTPSGRCIQKPYKDSNYARDYYNRIINGELYIEDSVKINEKEVFRTKKGKIVYGGGGIHPDFFVPQDTTMYNQLLAEVYVKQLMNAYVPVYYEKHQDTLQKLAFSHYLNDYRFNDFEIEEFKLYLKSNLNEKFFESRFNLVIPRLRIELKALIARSIWDDNEYYAVMNKKDKMVLKAQEVLNKK